MVTIELKIDGITEAVKRYRHYARTFPTKMKHFMERLGNYGVQVARTGFRNAVYDGKNDAVVGQPVWADENTLEIPVTGTTVAFIEFGTGTHYPDIHPTAHYLQAVRGGYGRHLGLNPPWVYVGDPGSNGVIVREGKAGQDPAVRTYGNPANMAMYNSAKEMRTRILSLARKVFADD